MRLFRIFASALCLAPFGAAQLTPAQKTADFMQLVGMYAKNYAPYELRRDVFAFDLYNIQPWLDQINKSTSDIEFYDILTRYVASLQDSHDEFITPSDFEAWLHVDVDIFDGKVLIADIDRSYLSSRKYPFQVGDELVSFDGVPAMDAIKALIPYAVNGSGNKTSQLRLAAASLTDRFQGFNPKAAQVGDSSTIVVHRQGGAMETYTIAWDKLGTPLTMAGPVPTPHALTSEPGRGLNIEARHRRGNRGPSNAWGAYDGPRAPMDPDPVPDYMQALHKLQYGRALAPSTAVSAGLSPFDNFFPVFDPPMGFKIHLGTRSTDQFLSGTFASGAHTIGYIRIPTMAPSSQSFALNQFNNEMTYMQQNTDGLVVDVMGNGGGNGCYSQALVSALNPNTFRGLSAEIRATSNWVASFSDQLTLAKLEGAPQWVIDLYTVYLQYVQQANAANRGMTGSLPLCGPSFDVQPLKDKQGNVIAYSKPVLVMTDNFTLSAAEIFAMFLQDSQRATIFGTRTAGGGGSVVANDFATDYSEGAARVTIDLITRAQPVATPGFPLGPYSLFYDGMGIYPDVVEDYQTLDNLQNAGATFINDASTQIGKMIDQATAPKQ
jgi:C-terminal processing protease CtpA/Prc